MQSVSKVLTARDIDFGSDDPQFPPINTDPRHSNPKPGMESFEEVISV
jgi:hypothetical protein